MNILVFTGSGISAESGIPTFRSGDGLWENNKIEDVATPSGFRKDPQRVWTFYRNRYVAAHDAAPNLAHYAINRLQGWCTSNNNNLCVVTQNIDRLHQQAGVEGVIELHGSIFKFKCSACTYKTSNNLWLHEQVLACPACGSGCMRPAVVWFEEQLPIEDLDRALSFSEEADIVIVVGTSLQVFPAADIVTVARRNGAAVHEFNLEQCCPGSIFHEGRAGDTLLPFVTCLMLGAI